MNIRTGQEGKAKDYIFISYAHDDGARVKEVMDLLEDYRYWWDTESISDNAEWRKNIKKAVEGSSVFLFFLSKKSAGSIFCNNELNEAYCSDHIKMYVIKLEKDANLPEGFGSLEDRQHLDFTEGVPAEKVVQAIMDLPGVGGCLVNKLDTFGDNLADKVGSPLKRKLRQFWSVYKKQIIKAVLILAVIIAIVVGVFKLVDYVKETIAARDRANSTYIVSEVLDLTYEAEHANYKTFTGTLTDDVPLIEETFTATINGVYGFTVEGLNQNDDLRVRLVDSQNVEIENFRVMADRPGWVYLAAGTYKLQIDLVDSGTAYTLKVWNHKESVDKADNSHFHDYMDFAGQENWYFFTPDVEGNYYFSITNMNADMVVDTTIYDSYNERIDYSNLDNGEGYAVANLKVGETYRLVCRFYRGLGEYTLNINTPAEVVDLSDYSCVQDSLYYDTQYNQYYFTPSADGSYCFTMEDMKVDECVTFGLYDPDGFELYSYRMYDGDSAALMLEEGKQYRMVVAERDSLLTYSVLIDGPGDTKTLRGSARGKMRFKGQVDVFNTSVKKNVEYNLFYEATGNPEELNVYIYDRDDNLLQSANLSPEENMSVQYPKNMKLVVKVQQESGLGKYKLKLKKVENEE